MDVVRPIIRLPGIDVLSPGDAMLKNSLSRFGAIVLCALAICTAPAGAQSLGLEFNFETGGSGNSEVQTFDSQKKGKGFAPLCLIDRQISRGLRDYGFEDIAFVRELNRNRVIVEALNRARSARRISARSGSG